MQDKLLKQEDKNQEISSRELILIIWQRKWLVVAITALFAILSVFYTLGLPNIYKAEVSLYPSTNQTGTVMPNQLSGVAALAGLDMSEQQNKTNLAIEILKSREFIFAIIEKYDLFVQVMAVSGWDNSSNQVLVDPNIYDSKNKEWVRSVKTPYQKKPSLQETYKELVKTLKINKNADSGVINVSIQHVSPVFTQYILKILVEELNLKMRQRDIESSSRSLVYLEKLITETKVNEVKSMLYGMIEEAVKTKVLANSNIEYVFTVIDPAVVPEEKFGPRRSLIVILFTLFGTIVSCLIILMFSNRKKQTL